MPTFAEQFEIFKNNVNAGMLQDLAETLGVTTEAIEKLGVGFHFGEQAWIFAERDAKGDIIGLSKRRREKGFKYMAKGSKRGLIYAYNQDFSIKDKRYDAGKFHWVRIADAGVTCPICGKPDWCMVSSDDPKDPSAVLCSRISDGSVREIGESGFLHMRKSQQQTNKTGTTVLYGSTKDLPTIIVEGASDVLAAMSLGFPAIGRPSAKGGMDILKDMPLAGHEVWIIGENDAGAGRKGVQKVYLNIKKMTETIQCIFPPEGIKDFRQWVERGLTKDMLFEYAGSHGGTSIAIDPDVFPEDTAYVIANRFIADNYTDNNGEILLRNYHGGWLQWDGCRYAELNDTNLRGKLYKYLDGKKYVRTTSTVIDVVPYKPTRSKISDILDAFNRWCPITVDPPVWLDSKIHIDPTNLMLFNNGMLDLNEFQKGNIRLHDSDPKLFVKGVIPYNYDENAWSNMFDDYCNQWFNEDAECIRLLAQWFGYSSISDMSLERLMFLLGPSRSGKGTCCEVLQGIVGKDQYCATSFPALADRYGLSNLVGKLVATIGDEKTPRKSEADVALATILRIVGRDYITINPKYITAYDYYPKCRFTIAMNDLPRFSDHAQALVNRSIILKFPNSYAGREDYSLKSRLKTEAKEGRLINFALWGLKDLRETGNFSIPNSSLESTEELRYAMAPVLTFCEECCILDNQQYIPIDHIFEAYSCWCKQGNYKPSNIRTFGRRLKMVASDVEKFRPTIDGHRQWAYKGITLQSWVYEKYFGRRK